MKPGPREMVVWTTLVMAELVPWTATAQESDLVTFLEEQRTAGNLPGLAAVVVDGHGFEWRTGLGWAEIDVRPVTAETPFLVASVSKPVTATALVAAAEDGLLSLDEDLRDAFGFPLYHPFFPDAPLTVRQLLAHASSIVDDPSRLSAAIAPGDPVESLSAFLARYLAPDELTSWSSRQPQSAFSYSNVGYALAGHLLEVRSGEAFGSYVERRLFTPLDMTDSAWTLAGLARPAALPYRQTPTGFVPYQPYGAPYAPAVLLRTSARDLGRFLALHLAGGRVGEQQLVSAEGIAEMTRVQFPLSGLQGLGWRYLNAGGRLVLGHGGSGSGATAEIVIDRRRGRGVALLTNIDATQGAAARAFQAVLDRLLNETDFPVAETPQPAARTWLLPSAIRGPRGGRVEYQTDLWLIHPGVLPEDAALEVDVAFQPRGLTPPPPTRTVILEPGQGRVLADVLGTDFGVTTGQGTFVITVHPGPIATPAVGVLARIGVEDGPGQWVRGEELAASVGERWLAGVHQDENFVATVALQNAEDHEQTLDLEAWKASGAALGAVQVTLGSRGFRSQRLDALFPAVAAGGGPFALRIRGGERFLASATLLDGTSGDPFYLPGQPAAASLGGLVVPRTVRGRGQRGALLTTEVALHNPDDGELTVRLELLRRGQDNAAPDTVTVTVSGHGTRVFPDVLAELFGVADGDFAGALGVAAVGEAAAPVVATLTLLRTAEGLRLGAPIPSLAPGGAAEQRVFGAGWGAGRDSAVGLLNESTGAAEVDLALFDDQGRERGRRRLGLGVRQHLERTLLGLFGTLEPFRGGTVTARVVGDGAVTLYLASLDEAGDLDLLVASPARE